MLAQYIYAKPSRVNPIPPVSGHFHEKTRIVTNRNVGIIWIRKARRVLKKPVPWSKTSKANRLIKKAKRIASTLGVQRSMRKRLQDRVFMILFYVILF